MIVNKFIIVLCIIFLILLLRKLYENFQESSQTTAGKYSRWNYIRRKFSRGNYIRRKYSNRNNRQQEIQQQEQPQQELQQQQPQQELQPFQQQELYHHFFDTISYNCDEVNYLCK